MVEGVETINLIAKSNKALNRLISQVKPKEVKKRIFIVGLFSPELLRYLRKKYPLANIEVRYFDILRPSRIKEFLMFPCVNYPRVFTYLNRSSTF